MAQCWCGAASSEHVCSGSKFHDALATGVPDKITRLYIAGPMSGYDDCNYPQFNRVAESLRKQGYEIVNPAEATITDAHYIDFLREDLRVMLDCHGVATLDKWWESVGARNEVQVAGVLKMPVRPWIDWVFE